MTVSWPKSTNIIVVSLFFFFYIYIDIISSENQEDKNRLNCIHLCHHQPQEQLKPISTDPRYPHHWINWSHSSLFDNRKSPLKIKFQQRRNQDKLQIPHYCVSGLGIREVDQETSNEFLNQYWERKCWRKKE